MKFGGKFLGLGFLVVSLGSSLFISEMIVRKFLPQRLEGTLFDVDYKVGYRHKAHLNTFQKSEYGEVPVQTNSDHLRMKKEISKNKSPNEVRILCLGDSFTFGWGVPQEKSFIHLLEEKLQTEFPDKEITLINAGHGGYSLQSMLAYFETYGLSLQPDKVILFMGPNDLEENSVYSIYTYQGGELKRNPINANLKFKLKGWINSLPLYQTLIARSHLMALARKALFQQSPVTEVASAPTVAALAPAPNAAATAPPTPKLNKENALLTEQLILRINRLAKDNQLEFLLAPVGNPLPETRQFLDSHLKWFTDNGIPTSFAAARLESDSKNQSIEITLKSDYHYNIEGNQFFANLVYEDVKKLLR